MTAIAHRGPAAPRGCYRTWLDNARRRGVPPAVLLDIVARRQISVDGFGVLDAMERIADPRGKAYFLVAPGTRADDIRHAVLLTYILNAGTGYRRAGSRPGAVNDFPGTPYGGWEVQRIAERQHANGWSYTVARAIVGTGGALVTTPNGMLMGVGGNRVFDRLSLRAGTTWGDVFLVNVGRTAHPVELVRRIVSSGHIRLDLDRVLHHEERHCQQWARLGPLRMGAGYLAEEAAVRLFGGTNRFEEEAGLRDGGYR